MRFPSPPEWPFSYSGPHRLDELKREAPPDVEPEGLTADESKRYIRLLSLQVLKLEREVRQLRDEKNALSHALRPYTKGF